MTNKKQKRDAHVYLVLPEKKAKPDIRYCQKKIWDNPMNS